MSEGQSMQVDLMGELQKRLDVALAKVEELEQELRVTDVRLFRAERTGKQAAAQLAEIIEQKDKLIAEANERADVRGKLAEAFGEVLCQIAGTNDRVRACAIASDKFAAMQVRLKSSEKIIELYKDIRSDIRPSSISVDGFTETARKIDKINQAINAHDNACCDAEVVKPAEPTP